jgi:hypothetical protein
MAHGKLARPGSVRQDAHIGFWAVLGLMFPPSPRGGKGSDCAAYEVMAACASLSCSRSRDMSRYWRVPHFVLAM